MRRWHILLLTCLVTSEWSAAADSGADTIGETSGFEISDSRVFEWRAVSEGGGEKSALEIGPAGHVLGLTAPTDFGSHAQTLSPNDANMTSTMSLEQSDLASSTSFR